MGQHHLRHSWLTVSHLRRPRRARPHPPPLDGDPLVRHYALVSTTALAVSLLTLALVLTSHLSA